MKRRIVSIFAFTFIATSLLLLPSFRMAGDAVTVDPQQGLRAFELLNKVRKDPNSYSERFGTSLKGIVPSLPLKWNDTLAAVAETKALDMAQKAYFSSVDKDGYGINYYMNKAGYRLDAELVKHPKEDDFAAFDGGSPSGEDAIKSIIIGKSTTAGGGKELLLAIGDFNAGMQEVGIGFVHGTKETKYRTYTCVIVARHHKK